MNKGYLRGFGLHSLFPNIAGTNPQFPASTVPGTTVASVTISNVSTTWTVASGGFPGVVVGMSVIGVGVHQSTVVTSVSGNSLGVSQNADAAGTVTLTFAAIKQVQNPGNQPTDGTTIRRQSSAEGGIIYSQDYLFIGTSVASLVFPKGVWDILMIGGGAGGGACSTGSNGTKSGGGGSASAFSFRGRFTFDGVGACDIIIGAGGLGGSSAAANGNPGSTTSIFLPSGLQLFVLGGSGGFGCSNTITGFGGVPGYPTVTSQGLNTAPFAFVYYGSGGGLNTSSILVPGIAGSCIEAGPVGGGAGAATNANLGGNGGQQGIIDGGGAAGSGNTGTTTGGTGGNAAANSGCGGGGAGGSFTAGGVGSGGNGGSGWVEAFRVG